jgi:hypothetical protein
MNELVADAQKPRHQQNPLIFLMFRLVSAEGIEPSTY